VKFEKQNEKKQKKTKENTGKYWKGLFAQFKKIKEYTSEINGKKHTDIR